MAQLICTFCGKAYNRFGKNAPESRFCSKRCRGAADRAKRVKCVCKECGTDFEVPPYRAKEAQFCNASCKTKWVFRRNPPDYDANRRRFIGNQYAKGRRPVNAFRSEDVRGAANPKWVDPLTFICESCGEAFTRKPWHINREKNKARFCSTHCRLAHMRANSTGANNPAWRGGHQWYYGANWIQQRASARARDSHTCQRCGKTREDIAQELSVHHIKRFGDFADYREANSLSNLVTLCPPCHKYCEWHGYPSDP